MKRIITLISLIGILALVMLPACEEAISSKKDDAMGKLIINITDAPFPVDMIDSAMVTIIKVELRSADEDSVSPFMTIMEDTSLTFNLIRLRNGISAKMIETDVPAGSYDLIRLYVDKASLTVKDGDTYGMKVPSGAQTGIKVFIKPALSISGGTVSELLLDFSLDKSFILKGSGKTPEDIKGFNFKPVIKAVNRVTAGAVSGMVLDTSGMVIGNAEVWMEQDSLYAKAYTDTLGYYGFIGVPAGSYDIHATAVDHDTVSFMDINVHAGGILNQDFILTVLNDTV